MWEEAWVKRRGREEDRRWAIWEQDIKGRWCVLVFSFTVSFKKKRQLKVNHLKKPKTPTRDGCGELRRATPVANPLEGPENRVGVGQR